MSRMGLWTSTYEHTNFTILGAEVQDKGIQRCLIFSLHTDVLKNILHMKGFLWETHQGHLSTFPEHGEGQVDHWAGSATLTDPAHSVTIGKFHDKLLIHLCVTLNSDTRSRYKVRDNCRTKLNNQLTRGSFFSCNQCYLYTKMKHQRKQLVKKIYTILKYLYLTSFRFLSFVLTITSAPKDFAISSRLWSISADTTLKCIHQLKCCTQRFGKFKKVRKCY